MMSEKPHDKREKLLPVTEIFGATFQGEGPLAGAKTMFVRFGGCDYRCAKCDSMHSVEPLAVQANSRRLTAEQIVDELQPKAKESGTVWVTLSGGNPCMWDLSKLVSLLHGAGLAVAVETQGTLWQPWLTRCQMLVISPKGPGMGEKFEGPKLINILNKMKAAKSTCAIAIKVVAFSQQDFDFTLDVQQLIEREAPGILNPGLMFLSLGNPFPPILNEGYKLESADGMTSASHKLALLEEYRVLMEDFTNDPRISHWRFLPQLHVLTYSNESER
jgi:7-carboxy-7-deazaguanine synthase